MTFVEIQKFGWNAVTLAFLATIAFGFYGRYGLEKQIALIRENGAASVSVKFHLTFCAMFISYVPYGWTNGLLALLVTASLRIPSYLKLIPLLYEKKGGFSRKELGLVAGLCLALLYMTVDKNSVFVGLSWLGVVMLADQPIQIWKNERAGSVSVTLVFAYWMSTGFWCIYGYATWNTDILAWAPAYLAVYSATLILARIYPNP